MTNSAQLSLRVFSLTPKGRDADLIRQFLRRAQIDCISCENLDELLAMTQLEGAGAVMVVEEALSGQWQTFAQTLSEQPAWSDLPVILFTMRYGATVAKALNELSGNVTVLERPLRSATVVSAVQSALQARRRQYEVRDLLRRQEELLAILAENDRRKDEFLALLGHELRNPLSAIQNAVHLLSVQRSQPASDSVLEILHRQLRNLRRLVDDLLDVSRVTLGKIQLENDSVDLRELIRRCIESMAANGNSGKHTLHVQLSEEPMFVSGDQVRLEQVLVNLISNSLKFTPPGGNVVVSVVREGDVAAVKVQDNGMGISAEMLPRVFDLFSQGTQSLNRASGGLGLGLSLARSLVERHGGTITAESKGEGKGSEFTIRLPLTTEPEKPQINTMPVSTTTGLRVLVVEDNDDARDTLIALLKFWGHEVEGAPDGATGLARIVETAPDLALVDIGLPEIDGYQVAQRACAVMGVAKPHLVAMTGYGQPEDRQRALDAGFDLHLVKPVKPRELKKLLSKTPAALATVS